MVRLSPGLTRATLALAAIELTLVAVVRAACGGGGLIATIAGLVLAPVAVVVVQLHGTRLAGARFGVGAGATAVLLPLAGVLYALPTYRRTYVHDALPSLVGLDHSGWFALGVAIAAAALAAPRAVLAAGGVAAAAAAIVVWGVTPLSGARSGLHEAGWSIAFLEWLVVAGVLGAARRSSLVAVGLGGWLVFFVLRAAHEPFAGGLFWQALAPVAPGAALLVASIALLAHRLRPARPASQAETP